MYFPDCNKSKIYLIYLLLKTLVLLLGYSILHTQLVRFVGGVSTDLG